MEITRNLSKDGTFSPAAVNILGQIPASTLFFAQHQLRHPESIYSFSLTKLAEAFTRVGEGYLSKTKEYGTGDKGSLEMLDLLREQENLFRVLQEHLDDCYLILKTFIDPALARRTPLFVDKYVTENRLPGARTFQNALADYKRDLRIANMLKHQQGRLRGVAAWLPSGVHLGYFLEGPDSHGQIGPSPEIHPDQGCISFARDLAWHLFNVYLCSEKLVAAIRAALGTLHRISLQPRVMGGDKKWDSVVALACAMPHAFFPKEVPKQAATFHRSVDGQTLTVRFPEKVRIAFPPTMKVTCSTVVDCHSSTFKVPFP